MTGVGYFQQVSTKLADLPAPPYVLDSTGVCPRKLGAEDEREGKEGRRGTGERREIEGERRRYGFGRTLADSGVYRGVGPPMKTVPLSRNW